MDSGGFAAVRRSDPLLFFSAVMIFYEGIIELFHRLHIGVCNIGKKAQGLQWAEDNQNNPVPSHFYILLLPAQSVFIVRQRGIQRLFPKDHSHVLVEGLPHKLIIGVLQEIFKINLMPKLFHLLPPHARLRRAVCQSN